MKEDFSTSNPALHELYVNWAMHHLKVINRALDELHYFSNGDLFSICIAIGEERKKLILENTAYRDAAARLMAGLEPVEERIDADQVDDEATNNE